MRAVVQDPNVLQSDEATLHHGLEHWQKSIDGFFAVDNFDDNRQVRGKSQYIRGVDAARLAKPHGTAEHGRSGKALLTRL
jgi:hypothetical protein